MSELRIRTTIEQRGPAAAIVLTDEQVASLGPAKAPPVTLTIGDATVRVRIGRMGGENLVGLSKERREALGVAAGDEVDAVIALDEAERTIEVPPELEAALAEDPAAKAAFDALAPSRRKELARSIADAKGADTRQRRLEKALDALRQSAADGRSAARELPPHQHAREAARDRLGRRSEWREAASSAAAHATSRPRRPASPRRVSRRSLPAWRS